VDGTAARVCPAGNEKCSLGYILSGITGTIVIGIVVWLFTMLVTARKSGTK